MVWPWRFIGRVDIRVKEIHQIDMCFLVNHILFKFFLPSAAAAVQCII